MKKLLVLSIFVNLFLVIKLHACNVSGDCGIGQTCVNGQCIATKLGLREDAERHLDLAIKHLTSATDELTNAKGELTGAKDDLRIVKEDLEKLDLSEVILKTRRCKPPCEGNQICNGTECVNPD